VSLKYLSGIQLASSKPPHQFFTLMMLLKMSISRYRAVSRDLTVGKRYPMTARGLKMRLLRRDPKRALRDLGVWTNPTATRSEPLASQKLLDDAIVETFFVADKSVASFVAPIEARKDKGALDRVVSICLHS